jgi:hypothetical protein
MPTNAGSAGGVGRRSFEALRVRGVGRMQDATALFIDGA